MLRLVGDDVESAFLPQFRFADWRAGLDDESAIGFAAPGSLRERDASHDRLVPRLGMRQQGRDVVEKDAGLGEVRDRPDMVLEVHLVPC